MQTDGWVKFHRKMLENPVVWKTPVHTAVWNFLLLNATHEETQVMFGGEKITLLPGQLLTSYQKIADKIHDSKLNVQRAINDMRNDTQIDTRTDRQQSLISVRNWDFYQGTFDTRNDTQIDTQMIHEAKRGKKKNKKGFSPNPFPKKQKIKSPQKENKNERSCNAYACEDDNDDLLSTEIRLFSWRDTKVLMLSEVQFDSICEQCGLDEIDYYMDRMVELVSKGYKFGCSHYEYILQMVKKDRGVRNETVP